MTDLIFSCTLCGKCCQNHHLPLTIDEATAWIEDGGTVAVFCEATTWMREPPPTDARAAYIRRRSFAALSGAATIRVTPILVAVVSGPCRNLGPDMHCRIYDRRPLVCRIYPAEINPFTKLTPRAKDCPPEAWQSGPPMLAGGVLVDAETQALIERSRAADAADVPAKRGMCRTLGIAAASVKEEGFAVHEPDQVALLAALRAGRAEADADDSGEAGGQWRLHSPWATTLDRLQTIGAEGASEIAPGAGYGYVSIGATPRGA